MLFLLKITAQSSFYFASSSYVIERKVMGCLITFCAEPKGTQALEEALLVHLLAPALIEPSRANVAAV